MKERILWIIDDIDGLKKKELSDEERYARNRAFSRSLGLKSDCVGWTEMNPSETDYISVFEKATDFCKKNGCKIRGYYRCRPDNPESEWFFIKAAHMKSDYRSEKFIDMNSETIIPLITAYKETADILVPNLVSERFVDVYKKHNMTGLRFCWAKDTGKYASKQYFYLFGENILTKGAMPFELDYKPYNRKGLLNLLLDKKKIAKKYDSIGGVLPEIYKYYYDFTVETFSYFPKDELPSSGFVLFRDYKFVHPKMLVHRDTAKILLEEKIIKPENLEPAMLYGEIPISHKEEPFYPHPMPGENFFKKRDIEYKIFSSVEKPLRKVTEKQALSALRKAKKENGEYLDKKISKEKAEEISKTEWAFLVPYYLVTAGGSFSNGEYHLLQFDEATDFNREYAEDLENDDTARDILPEGTVFGICADGDKIIKLDDGKVIRVSHEEPEILEEWPSVAQFIFDCAESED